MKQLLIAILVVFLVVEYTNACTTFVINDSKNLLFCRNYDYDLGLGFIVINKRGIEKQAIVFSNQEPARWISQYGSITFNQIGIDAPMGGMNEKGLVIAQMALPESQYPQHNNGKVLNQLEWIQFQLDNSVLVDDVIENSKSINIVPISTPVHYFICDSLGNMGVFEFINGKLIIYSEKDVTIPVCSNIAYNKSKKVLKEYEGFGGSKIIPQEWKSISDIIAIANSKITYCKNSPFSNSVDYGFEILAAVSSEERTQWSVVYDIKKRKIYFKSHSNKNIRTISLNDFDYSCDREIKILSIQSSNNSTSIISQFIDMTKEQYYSYKKELITWYKANIDGFPDIPDEVIQLEIEYAFQRYCK